MGTLQTWSGWKHSSHKRVSLCVGASHRGSAVCCQVSGVKMPGAGDLTEPYIFHFET